MGWLGDDRADPRAELEAENALRQARHVLDLIVESVQGGGGFRLTVDVLRELNRLALEGLCEHAGRLRDADVRIVGSRHEPPPHPEVERLLTECCEHVNESARGGPLHRAAYALWRINLIHPLCRRQRPRRTRGGVHRLLRGHRRGASW